MVLFHFNLGEFAHLLTFTHTAEVNHEKFQEQEQWNDLASTTRVDHHYWRHWFGYLSRPILPSFRAELLPLPIPLST